MKMMLDRRLLAIIEREVIRIEHLPYFTTYDTYRLHRQGARAIDLEVDHTFFVEMPMEQYIWFFNLTLYEKVTVIILNMVLEDVEKENAWVKDMAGKMGRAAAEAAENIFKEAQFYDEHESKVYCPNPGAPQDDGSRRKACLPCKATVGE